MPNTINPNSPKDESLPSYIYRMLKTHGYSRFTTVIIPKHGWGSKPSVPLEAREVFQNKNRAHLLHIFEQSMPIPNTESDFSNLFDHLPIIENTFFPNTRKDHAGKGIPISFCEDCLITQQYNLGFSYFKASWLNGKYCSIHSRLLSSLIPDNLANLISRIDGLLKCKFDEKCIVPCAGTENSNPDLNSRYIKFAPCAQSAMMNWVLANEKYYPHGYSDLVDYDLLPADKKNAFNRSRYRKEVKSKWTDFYQQLTDTAYKELMEFINNKLAFSYIKHPHLEYANTIKVMLKDYEIDCKTCLRRMRYPSCAKSNVIFRCKLKIYSLNEYFQQMNSFPLTTFEEDIEYKIANHQKLLGVSNGEYQVIRQIEKSKEYKKYGGKSNYELHILNSIIDIT